MKYYLRPFLNYANIKGRSSRREYWTFFIVNTLLIRFGEEGLVSEQIVFLFNLIILIPSLAVAIRRIHDTGKSGWFILVPFYNIYLLFVNGTSGENEFGPDPKTEDFTFLK